MIEYLSIGVRCLVGTVFLVSSASKVVAPGASRAFVASLHDLRLLPPRLVRPLALVVVVGEIAVWVLLATPAAPAVAVGFLLAAGLLVAFAVGIGLATYRGRRVPCRCFGASTVPLGPRHVVRNGILAAVATTGAAVVNTTGPLHPGGVVVAALAGLLLGGLTAVLDDLLALYRPIPS